MSKYTTGEMAKLCNVSVRTVQYYDTRGILVPGELSEGGRRVYSEDDLKRMKVICFLREMGLPINSIGDFLSDEDPGKVIDLLLQQQEKVLCEEIAERQTQLNMLENLKHELKGIENFTVKSIGDIAYMMENKKKMKKVQWVLLGTGIPVTILQWATIILWIMTGIWWPFAVHVVVAVVYTVWISKYYFDRVEYICPECHEIFKPTLREAFWAKHTPTLRKLTCTHCNHKGWCVETYAEKAGAKNA